MSTTTTNTRPELPSVEELIEIAYRHYPRWDRDNETLDEYLLRYDSSPEMAALKAAVSRALEEHAEFRAFLHDVQAAFPGTAMEIPPSIITPCFQVFVQYNDPPGSTKFRSIFFRLSHLAPIYDYWEIYERKNGRKLLKSFEPSPEAKPVTDVVEKLIAERFGYHRLDPKVGRIVLPHIALDNLLPGEATLADVLFEGDPVRR